MCFKFFLFWRNVFYVLTASKIGKIKMKGQGLSFGSKLSMLKLAWYIRTNVLVRKCWYPVKSAIANSIQTRYFFNCISPKFSLFLDCARELLNPPISIKEWKTKTHTRVYQITFSLFYKEDTTNNFINP